MHPKRNIYIYIYIYIYFLFFLFARLYLQHVEARRYSEEEEEELRQLEHTEVSLYIKTMRFVAASPRRRCGSEMLS